MTMASKRRRRSLMAIPSAFLTITALACAGNARSSPLPSWNGRVGPPASTGGGSSRSIGRRASSHASLLLPPQEALGGPAKHASITDTARTPTAFLGRSNYRVNHRHGSSYGNAVGASSSQPSVEQVIDSLVELLSPRLAEAEQREQAAADRRRGVQDNDNEEEEEARLWKRLGKLRLDAGEYAEAARIFRYGSERCPTDEGLRHHCRVYDAFHGQDGDDGGNDEDDKVPDPMSVPANDGGNADDDGLFLILDVPPDSVPDNIVQFSGQPAVTPSLTRIICASKQPILSREACRFLIQSAKDAAAQRGGWTTDRHVHAPTCDIPVFELDPAAVRWIRRGFHSVLLPLVASTLPSELGLSANNLRIQDCFVVRYDGKEEGGPGQSSDGENEPVGFASLKPHEDESLVSLTIALNDMSDYDGGGLFIASTGDLLNGDAGTVLSFAGGLVHGGYPVNKGTRWILTVFLYIDKNLSGKEPGYTIDAIEGAVKAEK